MYMTLYILFIILLLTSLFYERKVDFEILYSLDEILYRYEYNYFELFTGRKNIT
jgi:hypothetical protein